MAPIAMPKLLALYLIPRAVRPVHWGHTRLEMEPLSVCLVHRDTITLLQEAPVASCVLRAAIVRAIQMQFLAQPTHTTLPLAPRPLDPAWLAQQRDTLTLDPRHALVHKEI